MSNCKANNFVTQLHVQRIVTVIQHDSTTLMLDSACPRLRSKGTQHIDYKRLSTAVIVPIIIEIRERKINLQKISRILRAWFQSKTFVNIDII